mmetsp:Transcript_6786/g.17358  ORF Transcript_6786/g.17358 Transcript_6786/m.17358 type:complete len:389 (-) Transcript_6786:216-1382(-)
MATALVARHGHVVHYSGHGEARPGEPVQPDSVFRIYSMSKPITSLALLLLWEQGKLLLDQPVHLFLGERWKKENMRVLETHGGELQPCKSSIRVRQLLTHTAGLSYGFLGLEELNPVDGLYQQSERSVRRKNESLEEMVDRIASLPLCHQPGERWNYSYATDVVGRIVEVVSGESLDQFLQKNFFEPLDMHDTGFVLRGDQKDRLTNLQLAHPKGHRLDVTAMQHKNKEYTSEKRLFSGGGGLLSTMRDYARFCQFCLNKGELNGRRIIGRKSFEYAVSNHLPGGKDILALATPSCESMGIPGIGFGLGFAVDLGTTSMIQSGGTFYWGGMANTIMFCDPAEDLFALLYTQVINLDEIQVPLRETFTNMVYAALTESVQRDPRPVARL